MQKKSSYHFCGPLRKAEVFTPRLVLFSPPPVFINIPPSALVLILLVNSLSYELLANQKNSYWPIQAWEAESV